MSTAATAAARAPRQGVRSPLAAAMFADLMGMPPVIRRDVLANIGPADLAQVMRVADREGGTPYALWVDDARGFIELVLGETMWSTSGRIADAISAHDKVAVPSCFSSSKSWTGARLTLWWCSVHPIGTARVVTLAPIMRQVRDIIWPEIRRAHARSGLPGQVDTMQMKLRDASGLDHKVAYGIAAPPQNEYAVQGIHSPNLLLIVDEAGGLPRTIGGNLPLTGGAKIVGIGNPPTDDPASWFEAFSERDDVNTIRISAYSTPNLTGERTPPCRSCPPNVPQHPLSKHLVSRTEVRDAIEDHGEDSRYVQAKVHALFPKGGASQAIPYTWVEAAAEQDEPDDPTWLRLRDLGLPEETAEWRVEPGAWVRLGVDVAADGGDEFVIGRTIGNLSTIEHYSAGQDNADPVAVAGVILRHIRRAELVRAKLGTAAKVRVKVDANGIGWGVAGVLAAWGTEGLHDAEIVPVMVSESPGEKRRAATATLHPYRKRDEMWLAGRDVLRPPGPAMPGLVRMRVDKRTLAQVSTPTMGTNASGYAVIETKDHMKKRGMRSPDRAEAWLLSVYEPGPVKVKKQTRLLA